MAVEKYGGNCVKQMSWGTGESQAWVWVEVTNKNDDYCNVHIKGAVSSVGSRRIAQYGVMVQVGQNGSNQSNDVGGVFNYNNWVGNCDFTYTVPRTKDSRQIYCWTKYWGATVNGYGAGVWSGEVGVNVTIPARPRHAHGNPNVSTSNTGFLQGEKVSISWSKAATQGNAIFDHFELWRGNTKLYSGANTSFSEVASSVTGSNGGSITYTVKEVHEWYGTYPTTQTAKTVYVIKNHGNPTISLDRNGYYQGEQGTISWAKASNQGNSTLDRFELWRGGTKLYSGKGTSYKETPSSVTGSNGGSVTYTLKEVHTFHGRTLTTQATKSVSVIKNFGTPRLTASKSPCNYSESITLGFQKASEQGNSAFNKFEFYQGSTKLYSGSGTSYKVTPSDYSGARGGNVAFKLKEIHEWHGRYPEKETSLTVNVRSGVVSAYDNDGNKHTGLVTVYDSSGSLHYVLITGYDKDGKAHSVV